MKYKNKNINTNINIKYDDGSPIQNIPINKLNWRYVYSNYSRFLPLYDCVYCSANTNYNLSTYKPIKIGFLQCALWIYKIIKKYSLDECLIFGNSLFFLEPLLYYKIKKIGFYPECLEKTYTEDFFKKFNEINKSKKIILENNETSNIYKNIIMYISIIEYARNKWKPSPEFKDIIFYVHRCLKLLQKNGNFIMRMVYNEKQNFEVYTKDLIYIISNSFKSINYLIPEYNQESLFINKLIIFENYNENTTLINDVVNQMKDDEIALSLLESNNLKKFNKFFQKVKNKIFINRDEMTNIYMNKFDLFNTISPETNDKIYKNQFMLNLDKCVYLCEKAKLEVNKKYLKKNKIYIKKLEKILCVVPNATYHTIKYKKNNINDVEQKKYTDIIGEYNILKLYIDLKDKNKVSILQNKISISNLLIKKISTSKIIDFAITQEFIELYEIINTFNLLNMDENINIIQLDKNDTLAINYYYKKKKLNNIIINLKKDNIEAIIDKYNNIHFCIFTYDTSYNKFLIYILISIKVLQLGGSSIFKINITDIDNHLFSFIQILLNHFSKIHIYKSGIDPFFNNMIYIIAENKNKQMDNQTYTNILEQDKTKNNCDNTMIYTSFVKIIQYQINFMNMILYYYENIDALFNIIVKLNNIHDKLITDYITDINIL